MGLSLKAFEWEIGWEIVWGTRMTVFLSVVSANAPLPGSATASHVSSEDSFDETFLVVS